MRIPRTSPTTLAVVAVALATTAVAGCSADTAPNALPDSSTSSAPTPAEPASLADHVLPADAIAGYAATGKIAEQTAAEFAEEHEKTPAEVRRSGLVRAATQNYAPTGRGFAMSIAAEYGTPAQAEAEADRLFEINSTPEPGATAELVEVPGVPDADAVLLTGKQGGKHFTGVEVVFVDGTVLHEIFAIGVDPLLDWQALVAEVSQLHEAVEGRPLA